MVFLPRTNGPIYMGLYNGASPTDEVDEHVLQISRTRLPEGDFQFWLIMCNMFGDMQ